MPPNSGSTGSLERALQRCLAWLRGGIVRRGPQRVPWTSLRRWPSPNSGPEAPATAAFLASVGGQPGPFQALHIAVPPQHSSGSQQAGTKKVCAASTTKKQTAPPELENSPFRAQTRLPTRISGTAFCGQPALVARVQKLTDRGATLVELHRSSQKEKRPAANPPGRIITNLDPSLRLHHLPPFFIFFLSTTADTHISQRAIL